ncbi:MAG TPA: protein-L-isoaspartate(D-aspartate) O-methyltransferase [Candidatus Bathyarchaeia archaeon]|nr:protein-L-isoaspartate(D-aspartate) O-methyltransferase [Candidatus Bathyarchaeia archaeon]
MTVKAEWEQLIRNLIAEGILKTSNITRAIRLVSREPFLPDHMKQSYAIDAPLPIGWGQTASAPHMVSIMNEALQLEAGDKVLEVGAGSGWHAATIAEIIAPADQPKTTWGHVYTTEIIRDLADYARTNIEKAGYTERVTIIHHDGSQGYPPEAPYDRILVTAAAPDIPTPLTDQLKPDGGILLIPVGGTYYYQTLYRITKKDAQLTRENLGGVAFVPLTGKYGQHT